MGDVTKISSRGAHRSGEMNRPGKTEKKKKN